MTLPVHALAGFAAVLVLAVAAIVGGWCWWRRRPSRVFWWTLRAGQALVVVQAALGALLLLAGRRTGDLHLVYGLLPIAVSFFAEQLRISAAATVLAGRGFESAAEVGELAQDEQREVVMSVLRRELGVMTVAAAVMAALALRAGFEFGAF